jgi:hypothetical protein
MELLIVLVVLFLGGAAAYGVTQLRAGLHDLWGQLWSRLARPVRLRDAREGVVLLRGRARPLRKLLPALTGGSGCVAQVTRSGFGRGHEERATVFELVDGTAVARIEARHLVLCTPEKTDLFGDLTREVAPGEEILVRGRLARVREAAGAFDSYREPPTSLVVTDAGDDGVEIVRPTWQPLSTLGKGALALGMAITGVWLAIALVV